MANVETGALTAATALALGDIFHLVQSGNSRRSTLALVQTLLAGVSRRSTYGGTADAITLTSGSGISGTPPTGTMVRFRATAANTGATTIALDGGTAVACRTITGVALPASYIRTTTDTFAIFDGTFWVLDREIERVSGGSNGDFVRFADGTLICTSPTLSGDITTANGSGFRLASPIAWTFPAAFSTETGLSITASAQNNSDTHWATGRSTATTAGEVGMFAFVSATGRGARATAVGRWY